MLENARKRSDLIRQRYEERIRVLSDRIHNAEDEKQAAVTKLSLFDRIESPENSSFSTFRYVCPWSTQCRRIEISATRLRRENSSIRNRKQWSVRLTCSVCRLFERWRILQERTGETHGGVERSPKDESANDTRVTSRIPSTSAGWTSESARDCHVETGECQWTNVQMRLTFSFSLDSNAKR